MTREERKLAITYLEEMKENYIEGFGYERHPLPEYYAIECAIKALSQEPCDDCVKRQAVKEWLDKWDGYIDEDIIARMKYRVIDIPNALQEPKTGHWIDDTRLGYHVSICSNCNWRGHGDVDLIYRPKFCPNCGAGMSEEL